MTTILNTKRFTRKALAIAVVLAGLGLSACEVPSSPSQLTGQCEVIHQGSVSYGGNCVQAYLYASPPDVVVHAPVVTSVTGTLTVPTDVSCPNNINAVTSIWVGIDGYGGETVQQTGLELRCWFGQAYYESFVEYFPGAPQVPDQGAPGLYFAPGDTINMSVTANGGTSYTVAVSDDRTGQSYSTTQDAPGSLGVTGECISENPSGVSHVPFSSVTFGSCQVNNQSIGAFGNTQSVSADGISPSGLNGAGGFTVPQDESVATGWSGYAVRP